MGLPMRVLSLESILRHQRLRLTNVLPLSIRRNRRQERGKLQPNIAGDSELTAATIGEIHQSSSCRAHLVDIPRQTVITHKDNTQSVAGVTRMIGEIRMIVDEVQACAGGRHFVQIIIACEDEFCSIRREARGQIECSEVVGEIR